eukprot:s1039_g13.t2
MPVRFWQVIFETGKQWAKRKVQQDKLKVTECQEFDKSQVPIAHLFSCDNSKPMQTWIQKSQSPGILWGDIQDAAKSNLVFDEISKTFVGLPSPTALMAGWEEAGYVCVQRQVDPTDCGIPLSRPRLFYMGFRSDLFPGGGQAAFALELEKLWGNVVLEAANGLPKHRLDAFLFGDSRDPSLRDVPSVARALRQDPMKEVHLSIEDGGCEGERPKKRRRANDQVLWPTLHKDIMEQDFVTWQE